MTGQRQRQVIGRDAAAIVTHPQQLDPALLDINIDALGAGVEAVFQQFLDHRGRTFNHLTGGDLVRQPWAEQFDTGSSVQHFVHSLDASSVPGMVKC
ncbi:hypothetical protein D3C81_1360310 [compost metagenome]